MFFTNIHESLVQKHHVAVVILNYNCILNLYWVMVINLAKRCPNFLYRYPCFRTCFFLFFFYIQRLLSWTFLHFVLSYRKANKLRNISHVTREKSPFKMENLFNLSKSYLLQYNLAITKPMSIERFRARKCVCSFEVFALFS